MSQEKEIIRRATSPRLMRYPINRLGAGSRMTTSSLIGGSRLVMLNHNIKHSVQLYKAEFPRMFTGSENALARFSATIFELDDGFDYEVFKIIKKDEYNAIYVLKRTTEMYFRVVEREEIEELSEGFGLRYDNSTLDKSREGDIFKAGQILRKSTNFDKRMNYGYGRNLNTLYAVTTATLEDGMMLMNDADNMLAANKSVTRKIPLADNDIFLNMHGNDKHYIPFPRVGDKVSNGIFAVIRKKTNDKILTMTNDKLRRIETGDRKIYAQGVVTDITFYHNKGLNDILNSTANEYLRDIIVADRNFHKLVYKTLRPIVENHPHCDMLGFLYNRSRAHLKPSKLLVDDRESPINNIIMEVTFHEVDPCSPGTKMVGRHGNKG